MQAGEALTKKPHQIERLKVDSTTIAEVGYEDGVLVVMFTSGHLYAYQVTPAQFEAFAQATSKGSHFNREIKGKVSGQKLTGACPECGSTPEIIGEVCTDCGVGIVRAIDSTHKERR